MHKQVTYHCTEWATLCSTCWRLTLLLLLPILLVLPVTLVVVAAVAIMLC
jgi:hypothetical protein